MALKVAERTEDAGRKALLGTLKGPNATIESAALFRNSPLNDYALESSVLRKMAVSALERGVSAAEVRLDAGDFAVKDWSSFMRCYSMARHGSQVSRFLEVDGDGRLKASAELADYVDARIRTRSSLLLV
jgi:hypothetical protein